MNKKTVAILITTYNGSRFIREQLDSIINQRGIEVHFYISDDGSTDDTIKILTEYFKKYPNIFKELYNVNFKHPVKNFLNLSLRVPEYKYYAFSDQDDVWFEDKLISAISILENGYSLYGGRTQFTDENLNTFGFSPLFSFPTEFGNAIVQSIAGANTMVFNQEAMSFLRKVKNHPVTSIDWLLYILVTFYGKKVFYDKNPKILYRQHSRNDHGTGKSLYSRLGRFIFLLNGKYKLFNNMNVKMLKEIIDNQPLHNLKILDDFEFLRKKMSFKISCFKFLKESKIYRQTLIGNLLLKFALFFGLE
jgi:glycosyltransferase involved in cell wall biosynthesis